MSTAYVQSGRTAQKQRTRDALVAAARELVAAGERLTVEATADAASISRTTAYRYFPNLRSLLAAAHPATDVGSLLPSDPPEDPAERLDIVVRGIHRVVLDDEAQQRTMLRLSLEPTPHDADDLPLRQGRAIAWLTEALQPARPAIGDDGLRRLVLAIRSAIGIEALVWLVDVAGLSRRGATEQMRWTAQALLRGALHEASGGPI
jgi:AcrR family transcriptional regulator